jgi:Carboxypeptidase regulatory-like domain
MKIMRNTFSLLLSGARPAGAFIALAVLLAGAFDAAPAAAQSRTAVRRGIKVVKRDSSKGQPGTSADATKIVRAAPLKRNANGDEVGVPWTGAAGISQTTSQLMQNESDAATLPQHKPFMMPEREMPETDRLPLDSKSPRLSMFPYNAKAAAERLASGDAPQTVASDFSGATLADTGAFPPDSMGAVGPSQFVVFVNGRLRTFNKATGAADGVINANPDVFFSSVLTPVPAAGINFTSDPQGRFDKQTNRWFLVIIDVPSSTTATIGDTPNRVLIAVSDSASAGVISASTVWTFYYVQQNTVGGASSGEFLDYESLGIDNNALYVGGNMFGATSGSFTGCSVFVIRKSSVLNGGPVVTTAFRQITPASGEGMRSPRGVDNNDSASTEGYFSGPSGVAQGRLVLRRIGTPDATPTISSNILITVNATASPIPVTHLGNTGGNSGRLDALDTRLFAAQIRNGRLWTAHNIAVNASGVATTSGTTRRDAVRWYELNGIRSADNGGTPVVVQSGTIYDNNATAASARQYWIPTVAVSGQGHAALGYSTAGAFAPDAATSGRLRTDTLGTTGAPVLITQSTSSYNPSSDPGSTSGRRWGDYSFVSVDPDDDMTMWTIQEYCNAANSYAVRVAKLLAPPPATPSSSTPVYVAAGRASIDVTVTGTSVSGSEFFDPGTGFSKHISAVVADNPIANGAAASTITVNSITYVDPTHVTLNLNTVGVTAGLKDVTITNPDGQSKTGTGVINVVAPTAAPVSISGRVSGPGGQAVGSATVTLTDSSGHVQTALSNSFGYFGFTNVTSGETYVLTVTHKRFTFSPRVVSVDDNISGMVISSN